MAIHERQRELGPGSRPEKPRQRRIRRVFLRAGLVVLVAFVLASVGGYAAIRRTLPAIQGTERVDGLSGPVEVLRDRWGVPHIYATTQQDAFFAQGYTASQDRLWQMELFRHIGRGTLSEIFGKTTIDADRLMRTLGLRRLAEQEVAVLDPDTRLMLEAYAAGVNAFLAGHRDRLPIEFTILGIHPEPWSIVDSITWGKVMAWDLGANWEGELLRAAAVGKFGPEVLRELEPAYPAGAPIIIPKELRYQDVDGGAAVLHALAHPLGNGDGLGSNSWVVDSARSTTGAPLLANDPHLGIQMPALWYEVHLSAPGLNVAGGSFPGTPGVVIGHNDYIAWGMTNLGPDVQDLFVEKINPENPHQYLFRDEWRDMQVFHEEIKVKGQDPVAMDVLVTQHGPLLNGAVKGLGMPMALRWTALQPAETMRSIGMLDRAQNWEQFREALRYFAAPAQNFVYADTAGNIGYQAPGLIPVRASGDGMLPVPGWTGEYEWASFIPYDDLPASYNPKEHYIATANNKVVDDGYPYFLSNEWVPYRAQHLDQLLGAKDQFGAGDFAAMQSDVVSLPMRELAEHLAGLEPRDPLSRRALEYVRGWDGKMSADSVAAAIVQSTYLKLLKNVYADVMGEEQFKKYADSSAALPSLLGLLKNERSAWFTTVRTAGQPGANEVATESLRQGVADLRQRFGDDIATWRWGRLHSITFGHVLGQIQPLDCLFNLGPYEGGGSGTSLDANSYAPSKGFAVTRLASMRKIIDLGDFDRSLFIATTGQSGQPLSPHFGDMASTWLKGEYYPMLFSRAKIEANLEGRLVLEP